MSRYYDKAAELTVDCTDDARAQVYATLAVADALGRLASPSPADRLTAALTGSSDAMAMIDREIGRLLGLDTLAGELYEHREGWKRALLELHRRLREVDEPPGRLVDVAPALNREQLDELGKQLLATYTALKPVWLAMPEPDPLAGVKIGDVVAQCNSACGHGFACTRVSHPAQWQHIAFDDNGRVLAVWGGSR